MNYLEELQIGKSFKTRLAPAAAEIIIKFRWILEKRESNQSLSKLFLGFVVAHVDEALQWSEVGGGQQFQSTSPGWKKRYHVKNATKLLRYWSTSWFWKIPRWLYTPRWNKIIKLTCIFVIDKKPTFPTFYFGKLESHGHPDYNFPLGATPR